MAVVTWIDDDSYQMMTAGAGVPVAFVQAKLEKNLHGVQYCTMLLANIVVPLKPSNSDDLKEKYSC